MVTIGREIRLYPSLTPQSSLALIEAKRRSPIWTTRNNCCDVFYVKAVLVGVLVGMVVVLVTVFMVLAFETGGWHMMTP